MSGPIGTSQLMYSAAAGDFYSHQIANSVRFNRTDGSYLNRTIQAGGDLRKWTMSCWFKLSAGIGFGGNQYYLMTSKLSSSYDTMIFDVDSDNLFYYQTAGKYYKPNGAFRDPTAWGHLVVVYDSDNGTAADRKIVYLNGTRLSVNDSQQIGQNVDSKFNSNSVHYIGARQDNNASYYGDFYLAELIWADGQAYAPSQFGESKNGAWIPKNPSGTNFGTTGYHLKFTNSSDFGEDFSGNNNDWTANSMATHDQTTDTPTFNDTNAGNFATMNPLTAGTDSPELADGNLRMDNFSGSDIAGALATYGLPPQSGKWYFECFINSPNSGDNYPFVGLTADAFNINATKGVSQRDLSYNLGTGGSSSDATYIGTITTTFTGHNAYADNTVMGVFVDMNARKLWYAKDGSFFNSGNPQTGANASYAWTNDVTLIPHFVSFSGYGADSIFNFGQEGTFAGNKTAGDHADVTGYGNFLYDPGDYKALCTGNFPTPSTDPADNNEPTKNHGCILYTGTGQGSQAQTGLGFLPDMVIIKERGGTAGWKLFDSSRGVTNYLALHNTDAEADENDSLTAFGSDGFTVGDNAGTGANTSTYAAWCWKANGGTTATNSDGTLNCTQQVNANAGFSISTYTGNGQNSTIGHGLSSIPDITMFRERGTAGNWVFRIKGDGNDNNLYPQIANATSDGDYFQDTAATASVTSIGTHGDINGSTQTYVMWAWENKEGFSKHGLFEGNGNVDGSFVYLGFSPAFVMLKSLDSTSGWYLYDNKREGYNVDNDSLEWDVTTAEQTDDQIDLLSNGFKLRIAADPNVAETFVYMAFAAVPFKYATAR